ncbi:MAG: hypothetical protein ACP5I3_10290 [Thermoproteus sp.]
MYLGIENLILLDGEVTDEFRPYFYSCSGIPKSPLVYRVEKTDLECWKFDGLRYSPTGVRAYKIYTKYPADVKALRDKVELFSQAYIPFALRASADLKGVKLSPPAEEDLKKRPVRIMAMDVEQRGRDVFLAYSADGKDVTVTKDPSDVLAAMDVDYLVTYNGDEFDIKFLDRWSKYFVDTPYGYKPHVDLFVFANGRFKSAFGLTESGKSLVDVAYQLGLISNEELKYKMARRDIASMSDREIKEYVSIDVKLTYKIGTMWVALLEALSKITGLDPMAIRIAAESASTALLAEVLYHKRMEKEGAVLADRKRQYDFPGGDKVKAKSPGVYRGVVEYDFAAMYPTTYYMFHVNPIGVKECGDGFEVATEAGRKRICFDPSPISEVMSMFYLARKTTKKMKEEFPEADQAVKILANSAYGKMSSTSWGIVNEWAGAFIFQYTEMIFQNLWSRFSEVAVYGDTDSLYVTSDIGDDLNAEAKKFGELYEMKVEGRWDYMILVPSKKGGNAAAEKAYLKISGDKVVIKGAKLRPHNMPAVLRYGGWRSAVLRAIRGERLQKVLEEIIRTADLPEIFVEKSTTLRDIFMGEEGPKKKLDYMSDVPLLFKLAIEHGVKSITVTKDSINGKRVPPATILDVEHIPVVPNKRYILYVKGRVYDVTGDVKYSGEAAAASISSYRLLTREQTYRAVMDYLARLDSVDSVVKAISPTILSFS